MMEHFLKQFMDFNQALRNHTARLFQRYSIQCPDEAGDYKKPQPTHLGHTDYQHMNYTYVPPDRRVAFVRLTQEVVRDKGEVLRMSASIANDAQAKNIFRRADWIPAHFLPWDKNGGIVECTIPAIDLAAPPSEEDNPSIFFTAALSGCSVFVKGNANAPIVQHAGIETAQADSFKGAEAAQYWRDFSDTLDAMSHPMRAPEPIGGEANKSHYVVEGVIGGNRTTQHAHDFEARLRQHYSSAATRARGKDYAIQMCLPWGCVYGLRDAAGLWTFFLQENATIVYLDNHTPTVIRTVSRPMTVREIYPNFNGAAALQRRWMSL